MFQLVKESVDFSALNRPRNIAYHRVFDTVKETGGVHFLHGAAVEKWQGRLAVCFAFNSETENSITEQLYLRWSDDGGYSWSDTETIAASASYANSHSVFLPREDGLWCFGPRFLGLGEPALTRRGHRLIRFTGLQMEAWRYNGASWQSLGIVGEDFWPLGAPEYLDSGCWMIAGCDTDWQAAIALSRGDDLTHWDVVKPDHDGHVYTEAAAWAQGSDVMMVMRNQSHMTNGRYHAAVAVSHDGGQSFGPCEISNLPMSATKPFCGRLEDGSPFLVFNESVPGDPCDRSRMLLGVGRPDSFRLDRFWVVDEGHRTPQGRRLALSYPYARAFGGRLYITYSCESVPGTGCNHNDAMLAIIDAAELMEDSM